MRRIASIGVVLGLIMMASLVGVLVTILYPLPPPQPPGPSNDNELFYGIKVILSVVNTTLLVSMLVVYFRIYKEIKSKFTLSLIMVIIALLAYAVTSNPAVQLAFGYRAEGLGPFAIIPDLFTAIALSILLEMSLE